MSVDGRTAYISGLRRLADLLESRPELDLPYAAGTVDSGAMRMTWYHLSEDDPKTALAAFARMLGRARKEVDETGDTFRVVGALDGLYVEAVAYRNQVCERIVTGTREVEVLVPDPAAAPTPLVKVTRTVEDVEWDCGSLLSAAVPS